MKMRFVRCDVPIDLPRRGDLVYLELPDGTRTTAVVTGSEIDEDNMWHLRAITDDVVAGDQPGCESNR